MDGGPDRLGGSGSEAPVEGAKPSPTEIPEQKRPNAEWDSAPVEVAIPNFQYRYPDEIPEIEQEAIESIRAQANRNIGSKSAHSYEEMVQARYRWLMEITEGAAGILGRLAAREHWGANRRRDLLRQFAIQAAYAAHITNLVAQRFFESNKWKELDFLLFPALTPEGSGESDNIGGEDERDIGGLPSPQLDVRRICEWLDREGWENDTLARELRLSNRTVSSLRNNGGYHGKKAVTKLANLMGCDAADLYLPPEASS